jgi:bis(5'-nucleosidyl)-tetraphosphatase
LAEHDILNCMIRDYIRALIESENKKTSAGIVVLKNFNNEFKVLCLLKQNGSYDITKGLMELGESPLETALRETLEEAGISDLDFTWGQEPISYGKGIAFVAQTYQDPTILPNPSSGVIEHESFEWKNFEDAANSVIEYLVPAIRYAQFLIER